MYSKNINTPFKTLIIALLLITFGAGCITIQEDASGKKNNDFPNFISGCGDQVCDSFESQSGKCPQDCKETTNSTESVPEQ